MGRRIQQHSAGGVVFKQEDGQLQILLIRPHGRSRWQLPKGTIDPGESPEVTAVREVREEGGVQGSVLTSLEPITFFYQMSGQRFVKTVDFFLMKYVSGSPEDHDHEIDEAKWFPADEAIPTLTFESEQGVVRSALEWLSENHAEAAS